MVEKKPPTKKVMRCPNCRALMEVGSQILAPTQDPNVNKKILMWRCKNPETPRCPGLQQELEVRRPIETQKEETE